jgi:hypothetical protein
LKLPGQIALGILIAFAILFVVALIVNHLVSQ